VARCCAWAAFRRVRRQDRPRLARVSLPSPTDGPKADESQKERELQALFHRLNNQLGVVLAHAELLEAKASDAVNRDPASPDCHGRPCRLGDCSRDPSKNRTLGRLADPLRYIFRRPSPDLTVRGHPIKTVIRVSGCWRGVASSPSTFWRFGSEADRYSVQDLRAQPPPTSAKIAT
jgi:hypothetical protein